MTENGSPGGVGCLKLSEKGSGGTVNNATTSARLRQTLYDHIRTLSPGEAICRMCKIVGMTQPEYARVTGIARADGYWAGARQSAFEHNGETPESVRIAGGVCCCGRFW